MPPLPAPLPMLDLAPLLARVPAHDGFPTLADVQETVRALCAAHPGLARLETVGRSSEGRAIDLLSVGHGRIPVLLAGVPHPNEPIGVHTVTFLARLLCEDEALRRRLDVTLHVVPVADPDGYVLNEGWFTGSFSPLRYATGFYRPPHREQVEWSFPVDYKTLRWTTPAPETAVLMRVMERVRPRVFYPLHNAGFCGVYFYLSHDRAELVRALHACVAAHGLPLHRGEPEVPYLRTLAPATYALFGIDETYDYLARTLGEDPAPLIDAGTCSDDWLKRLVPDALSLVCELPYYTAPALEDVSPSGESRRDAVLAGLARAEALHAETAAAFDRLADRVPDHRLTRAARDYLARTPRRIAAERADAATPAYDREATRAEQMDVRVCGLLHHACHRGHVYRLARLVGDAAVADALYASLDALTTEIAARSALRVLPIGPLVAVQAGAGLLAMAAAPPVG